MSVLADELSPTGPDDFPPPVRKPSKRPPPVVAAAEPHTHPEQPNSREFHDGAFHHDTPRFASSPVVDPAAVTPGGRKRPPSLTDGMFIPLVKTPQRGGAGLHYGGGGGNAASTPSTAGAEL